MQLSTVLKTKSKFCKFFIACLGFALVNVAFACNQKSIIGDGFEWQNQNTGWWTIKNFKQLKTRPDVLLIGSSLMCRITNEGEATYLQHRLNGNTHHRSQYLEHVLEQGWHQKVLTSSLSVPGMNVSDVSVVFSELVKNDKVPDVIIYGIAPRDFLDNGLDSPASTSLYQLMEKSGDLQSVANRARLTREARAKYAANKFLNKVVPLYGAQTELSVMFRRFAKAEMAQLAPAPAICNLPPLDKVTKSLLHLYPEDADAICDVTPFDASRPNTADFKNCYLVSYNPFRPALYKPQLMFLERFLKIASERGAKVVLVNMPLRKDSFDLMPPNLYNLYLHDAQTIASAQGAKFIDLQNSPPNFFSNADYDDQVHLTGRGALKFVDALTPQIAPFIAETIKAKSQAREVAKGVSLSGKEQKAVSY